MNYASNVYNSALVTEVRSNTVKYAVGGLSLVAALGWNEAIKGTIHKYYPMDDDGLKAKYIYAFMVTLLLVLFITVTSYFGDLVEQKIITAAPI